ncbi:hypothetical protein B0H65DRAFT_439997 [Neurospora tetraspora]|uniref:Developmental regulatory protein wetA n=1 Tax=Neurospora tetraspora TaxID=94610 RepID=A0AAE0JKT2_9PEZI|nr:hypothetical protein B0H65DRAFT_439997 [Neurospora tetraspora]
MVTVQGMSFAVSDLPLGENKGGDNAFCWQDAATDDAGSADFFDQFVVLDDHGADHSPSPPFTGEEGGAEGGGNESFESMCREAHESSLSPPLTSLSCPPLDHHPSAEQLSGVGDHDRASVAANNSASGRLGRFSSAKFPPQHRQVRAGSHVDLSNMDCQYSQQHHQLLVAGQREISSILGTGYQEGPGSGGSISDSELLRLEGLTVNGSGSPRIHLPPSSASVPPSPHLQPGSDSTSPRKSRLEAFYTKIRNKAANLHGNKQKQHPATTAAPAVTSSIPSAMGTSPNKMTARPRPHNLSLVRPEMPLSPPLTGQMAAEPNSHNDGNNAHLFNTNFMDDPFMDISSNMSLPMHTPIQTPHQQHQSIPVPVTTAADNSWQFSVSGPPPTTPANPSTLHAVGGVLSSASELHSLYAGTLNDSNWWDQAVGDAMDTDPDPSSSFHMGTNASNTREATLNLQMALQQLHDQGSFDDHHFGLDTSGLVMHMPQPTSRVSLHHNQQQQQQQQHLNQSQAQSQAQAQAQAHAAAQLLLAQQQYVSNSDGLPPHSSSSTANSTSTTTTRSRRPKPRAPSSGASRLPSYQTSPRKVRAVSRSSRESSPTRGSQQPNSGSLAVPGTDSMSASGSGRQRLHRCSASMQNINHQSSNTTPGLGGLGLMSPAAVRKRKSFTGRGHASSVSVSAGSRLSHAASHGDLGASASAFAAAIGASGHRVVPEGSGTGSSRGLTSSASTSSLPTNSSAGRFTPLNMNNMNGGGFHHPHHVNPGVMAGYPPMPPLPPHHLQQGPGPGASSSLPPPQHQHQHQHHGLGLPTHHHPSFQHKSIPMHPSSSRYSPSKSKPPRSSSSVSKPQHLAQSSSSGGGGSGGGGGGGGIDFVNFTPLDHHTLMSGGKRGGGAEEEVIRGDG